MQILPISGFLIVFKERKAVASSTHECFMGLTERKHVTADFEHADLKRE